MDRPGRLWTGLVAAAALLPGCASPEFRSTPDEVAIQGKEVLLPVHWWSTYALVEVSLDGEGPYTMILDTGATNLCVSPDVAARHPGGKREFEESVRFVDSGGRHASLVSAIRVDSLRMGETRFRGIDAMVVDTAVFSNIFGCRVDGLLGISLFSRGLLTIDYPRREVRYGSGSLGPVDGSEVLPLFLEGFPCVDMDWEGEPIRAIVDSGSNAGFNLSEWPARSAFASGPVVSGRSVSILGATDPEAVGRLRGTLAMGRFRFPDPIVKKKPGRARIGMEVLGEFRFTIDCAHARVGFQRGPAEYTFDSIRGIGASLVPANGTYSFLDVTPGLPADTAGLREGDLLVSVDGMSADGSHELEFWAILFKAGHSVRLKVRRGGRDLEFEVPVVDIVR